MKMILKEFQESAVEKLFQYARTARREVEEGGDAQALVLASPTGSGKTMIATALMERIVEGDDAFEGDPSATFLWLTDAPDLNEQSRRKILEASNLFGFSDLITIDSDFKERAFEPGKVYFLNTQKLGKEKDLVTESDDRPHTIWEIVNNTIEDARGSFWLVLDEAHKGMLQARDANLAATIVQKFVKSSAEIEAAPLILGISATPERFVEVLEGKGTTRVKREYSISPDDVRASGLLKETIRLIHPSETQPSDWSLLRAAAERLKRYRETWHDYCEMEGEVPFEPALIIQVEDTDGKQPTRTDLGEALTILEDVLGPLEDYELAQCFQEGVNVAVGDRVIRHVSPADIQDDEELKVVFFKLSLNTGWDCPRAEVIMSFRKALDYTRIAQLVGRLVRTPLARAIKGDDFLNSVALFLPHYDKKSLQTVVDYLSKPETGLAAPPEIVDEEDLLELPPVVAMSDLFQVAETLPTYVVEKISKASNVRRLIRLGRALAYDKLDLKAYDKARSIVLATLEEERKKKAKTAAFKKAIKEHTKIDLREVAAGYGVQEELEVSFDAVQAASQNIDDLYDAAARKLGEGLHTHWMKERVAAGENPTTAKLELHELLSDEKVVARLEDVAGEKIREWTETHKAGINGCPDGRREVYRKLRRQAAKPLPEDLELPGTYTEQKGDASYERHLYADESGEFTSKLTGWEKSTIEAELADEENVVGWLRNLPRKSWSFTVPYKHDGEDTPMYPDFLFFRKQGDGIVVDVLEPHATSQDDSWEKAVGLADFAVTHGDKFGRIEIIIKEKEKLLRLDVNKESVRDKVRKVRDNTRLRELFDSDGSTR